jgi:hypothetical protein
MSDPSKQEQINRAWRQHRGDDPDAIPSEIRRKVRRFKQELTPIADNIFIALEDEAMVKTLARDFVNKRGIPRKRAEQQLRKKFVGAEVVTVGVNVGGPIFEARWLEPAGPFLHDGVGGEKQDCVLGHFLVIAPSSAGGFQLLHSWSIEACDHALGRFFQRAAPEADLTSVILSCGVKFMNASAEEVLRCVEQDRTVYLSGGGGGLFVCNPICGIIEGQKIVFTRARTFLGPTQIGPNQKAIAAADDDVQTVGDLVLRLGREGY